MMERGRSAYAAVDGEETVAVPAQACVGRTGSLGKTFSGHLNLHTGRMRFDCAEELPFYLEVDLSKVPALNAHPQAPGGVAAAKRARRRAAAGADGPLLAADADDAGDDA
jgi:hypothetical protein